MDGADRRRVGRHRRLAGRRCVRARRRRRASARSLAVQAVVGEVRRFRSDQGVKPSQRVPARHHRRGLRARRRSARCCASTTPAPEFAPTASLTTAGGVLIELDLSGGDRRRRRARPADQGSRRGAARSATSTRPSSANEAFTAKAPDAGDRQGARPRSPRPRPTSPASTPPWKRCPRLEQPATAESGACAARRRRLARRGHRGGEVREPPAPGRGRGHRPLGRGTPEPDERTHRGAASTCSGEPQRNYRAVHLTGTNGKTSTARMVDELLRGFGLRTGRFTSPHLIDDHRAHRHRRRADQRPHVRRGLSRDRALPRPGRRRSSTSSCPSSR